ncbi:MAG: hypothetical protein WC821_01020 [archaeon]|jgi:hypothetical protein
MGIGEKLKDIYYLGEEKWYAFWDKIDAHVPVYKVIDPVDNIVPSFALFLILIFLTLLLLGMGLFGIVGTTPATLKLSVVDSDGASVSGAKVTLVGIEGEYYTNEFGMIQELSVAYNSVIEVTAEKGEQTTTVPVTIDDFVKVEELRLPVKRVSFSQKAIRFETETGEIATGEMTLVYRCSSGITPPEAETIYGGTTNVSQSEECGTLTVDISSPKYATKSITLIGPSNVFTVESKIPTETVRFTVNLKVGATLITENVTVQAFRGDNSYIPFDTKQASNGQAIFDLPLGDYKFKVRQEAGYKQKETPLTTVSKSGAQFVDLAMEKNYIGFIKATAKEGSIALEGVYLTLLKKLDASKTTEINNTDTNSTGEVLFELAEEGNYVVVATKDGYCDASRDANVGDSVTLSMVKTNSNCGNPLKVRVIDQDGKAVSYAKVALFGSKDQDEYKLSYTEKITDYNGYVTWNPVVNSKTGETYRAFAFKASYSGWSEAKEFSARNSTEVFTVQLQVPLGKVRVSVKDIDNKPIQFAEVQLFDEYIETAQLSNAVSGKRMVENIDGTIEFAIKSDKKVYAVIKKLKEDNTPEYESYTTMPVQVIGDGTISFDVVLVKPPVQEISVNFLGLFKNNSKALKVEANQEYDALFEVTAPHEKDYEELGLFVRMGKDNITKTELDKIFIKSVMAPAKKTITTGATYNKPKGYAIDEKYINLEEAKWAEVRWTQGSYTPGKIIVGVKVKIRPTAQAEERLDIGYRAWGIEEGDYERDLVDAELGKSQNSSAKQELYASTKEAYVSVGTETLCENVNEEKSFCITSTYTDPDNFTQSFTDSFEAKNNSKYSLSIKVMNNSLIGFDRAKTMLANAEENLYIENYSLLTPKYTPVTATINAYETDWIDTPGFVRNSSIDFVSLNVTPQKTGSGTIKLRIREDNSLVFEKTFTINVASDKKMSIKYMQNGEFVDEMPKIVSGKESTLTIKAVNVQNNVEVEGAIVKIYDRFGALLLSKITNKSGQATLIIPASFPGEKLRLQIEKPEYETLVKEFTIAEDVIEVSPTALAFTVNPQSKPSETKTVKITNKTGLDLTIKDIKLTGKLKGLLNEAQIESWFAAYVGTVIKSQDFEEIDFKVIAASTIPTADDLDGVFEITVGSDGKEWVKEVEAKIRVGLGKDVDNPSCLEVTQTSWTTSTRGNQVETSFEIKNNCIVDGKPVSLKNMGATLTTAGTIGGTFTAQTKTVLVELGTAYARVFKTTLNAGEKIPVTVKFTPMSGGSGQAVGSIVFEALNSTDSKSQKITAEMKYDIAYENIQDCVVIGADLITISAPGSASFSITNSCKTKADFQLDSGDLQGAISNKTFTLNASESKDITVTASEGQVPGAYSILVYSRQQGTSLEIIGNVKVIIEDESSCFSLTRYQYDVYDSPFNEFDGIDRGYLKNSCLEKTVSAKVDGIVPYDYSKLWKMAIMGAITGGIGGYINQDKDSETNWWGGKPSAKDIQNAKDHPTNYIETRKTNVPPAIAEYAAGEQAKISNRTAQVRGIAGTEAPTQNGQQQLLVGQTGAALEGKIIDSTPAKKGSMASAEEGVKLLFAAAASGQKTTIDNDYKLIKAAVAKIQAKDNEIKQGGQEIVQSKTQELRNYYDTQNVALEKSELGVASNLADTIYSKEQEIKKQVAEYYTIKQAEYDKLFTEQVEVIQKNLTDINSNLEGMKKPINDVNTMLDGCGFIPNNRTGTIKAPPMDYADCVTKEFCQSSNSTTKTDCAAKFTSLESNLLLKENTVLQGYYSFCNKCLSKDRDKITGDATQKANVFVNELNTILTAMKNTASRTASAIGIAQCYGADFCSAEKEIRDLLVTNKLSQIVAAQKAVSADSTRLSGLVKVKVADTVVPVTNTGSTPAVSNTDNTTSTDPTELIKQQTILRTQGVASKALALDNYDESWNITDISTIPNYPELGTFTIQDDAEHYEIWNQDGELWQLNGVKGYFCYNSNMEKVSDGVCKSSSPTGQFILANSFTSSNSSPTASTQNGMMNALLKGGMGFGAGYMTNSWGMGALAGAATTFMFEWLSASDTPVNYSDSFVVPMVEINNVALTSPEGIQMTVGEKTFDYDSYYGAQSTGTTAMPQTGQSSSANYTGNVLFNQQALSATMGLAEIRELEFVNAGKAVNRSQYQPFTGILTVTGEEKVYDMEYDYDYIKEQADKRGEAKDSEKSSGIFGALGSMFSPTGVGKEIAQIDSNDLVIKEIRNYEKKFHLLFDSYEYVDCGPKTYACPAIALSNCDVDGKKGITGSEAVPKIKLGWNWSEIDAQECDSENNSNYIYCDSTQFAISTLKKVMYLRDFFKNPGTSLKNCPTSLDIVGSKTQLLSPTSMDVAITSVVIKPVGTTGATIETIVENNNGLELSAELAYKFARQDGTLISNVCATETKTFTSGTKYICNVSSTDANGRTGIGTGTFNIDLSMTPKPLCSGCENNDTANDLIKTTLVLGSAGAASCQEYKTNKDYFEKVLNANSLLTTDSGKKVIQYISFKTNLLRDGFTEDFKNDFIEYITQIAGAPPELTSSGVKDLFLSDKFSVTWPNKPTAFEAGKYDVRILIKFKNNSWEWDNNNIESIIVDLAPQGEPDMDFPIYDVAFDGTVGMNSENGRQGYGAGYIQMTDDLFTIANDEGVNVIAQPNARSNAITNVNVSVIKGTQAFNILNSSPTRGNVLSISRIGDDVDFVITPSVAVPVILNVTRGTGTDAYAFYQAEVNGQPQETGSSFITWTGIGQGCVAFDGTPMTAYYNTPDSKSSGIVTGAQGYGMAWMMASVSGTSSFYGSFFAPQDSSTIFKIMNSKDSATLESTHGNGELIQVSTAGVNIKNLKDVIALVKTQKVCVIGGDYYWNNTGLREEMKGTIDAKESTCISSR